MLKWPRTLTVWANFTKLACSVSVGEKPKTEPAAKIWQSQFSPTFGWAIFWLDHSLTGPNGLFPNTTCMVRANFKADRNFRSNKII